MPGQHIRRLWQLIWSLIGRVPLRTKIIGIVIAATCSTGLGVVLWTTNRLSLPVPRNAAAIPASDLSELVVAMIIAAAIGLVVAWVLTSVLTRQVREVTRVAQQARDGSLSERAPVWANDEIGALARAFNAMMDSVTLSRESLERTNAQLGARNRELTALYELAMLATRATSADAILPDALDKVLAISHAEAGAVLLRGEDGALAVRAARNLPAALNGNSGALAAEDPFLQQAVAVGKPLVARPGEDHHDAGGSALYAAIAAGGFGCVCAVPLQSRGSVNGLVVLLRRSPSDAPETADNLSFIATICNQLGVSVENATLWESLTHKEAVRARLLANAVTAQEQERERISRELHDETGQALTALLVQLRVFEHLSDRQAILAHAAELRKLVLDTLEEVRRLARDLRPGTLDELGLVPTIEWHVRTFTRNTNLQVSLEAAVSEGFRLPVYTELALYRVVQEALTNAARHASATHAHIRLEEQGSALRLSICDDGCGFDVNAVMSAEERGLGLHGIQERVELIGGTLALESAIGRGTCLRVSVPVVEK